MNNMMDTYRHYIGSKHDLYSIISKMSNPAKLFGCSLIDAKWIIDKYSKTHSLYRLQYNLTCDSSTVMHLFNTTSVSNDNIIGGIISKLTFEDFCILTTKYPFIEQYFNKIDDPRIIDYAINRGLLKSYHMRDPIIKYASQDLLEDILDQFNIHVVISTGRISLYAVEKVINKVKEENIILFNIAYEFLYTEVQLGYLRALDLIPNTPMYIVDELWRLVADNPLGRWNLCGIKYESTWNALIPYLIPHTAWYSVIPSHLLLKHIDIKYYVNYGIIYHNMSPSTLDELYNKYPEMRQEIQKHAPWDYIKSRPDIKWNHDVVFNDDININEYIDMFGHLPNTYNKAVDFNKVPSHLLLSIIHNDFDHNPTIMPAVEKLRKMWPKWRKVSAYCDVVILC